MHTHQFIGNLTRDARLNQTQNGTQVLGFAVAVNDRRTQQTTYIDCSVWGKLATVMEPWMKKGQKVFVQGDFGTDEYNGNTKITCNVGIIELVGGRDRTSSETSYTEHDDPNANKNSDMDDEIPF